MYKSFFNLDIFKRWIPVPASAGINFLFAGMTALTGMTILLFIPGASAQELFQESYDSMNRAEQQEPHSDPLVIRNRQAVMDSSQLFQSVSNNKSVTLNLFTDVELKAQVKNARSLSTSASFMSGSLEGGGHITVFISKEGIIRGEVHSPRGVYTIRSSKGNNGNNIIIRQIDTSKLPDVDDDTVHVEPDFHSDQLDSRFRGNDGVHGNNNSAEASPDETVDILVVYTPGAERSEGGKVEIEATIRAEVEKTNQAFENSGLSHRKIRLVAMEKVNYTQSSNYIRDDLLYLSSKKGDSNDPEGILDEVHELREKYAADLVHLVVEQIVVNCGWGFGYTLNQERLIQNFCADKSDVDSCVAHWQKDGFQRTTFSISAISCSSGYTFTHELGHNFGIYHDRYPYNNTLSLTDTVEFPYKPYGFGYVNQNFNRSNCYRTIMAYENQCKDEGYTYSPIEPIFSNPDLNFMSFDDPAGVSGEEWTEDLDGPANASRAIDEVWDIVANLYHSSTSCSNMLFSNVPESVRVSASGGTKRYTLSSSSVDADYCSSEDINLTVSSNDSFITASVETKTVTDNGGDESYEYDVTITVRANNSCNSRTGSVSFSGDEVFKDISISQSGPKLCSLISGVSSDTDAESLVSLNFSGESVSQVGGALFTKLTGLESLNLSNNNLKTLPANAFTRATSLADLNNEDEGLSRKYQIHLISNNMSITGLVNVKELDLSNNLISRLHALTFSNLFNLEELNLSNNRITGLPANVFSDLVELEELDLSGNQIRALPAAAFAETGNLEKLNVSKNQIRSLPATVFNNLSELEELDLSDNRIANLPTDVFSSPTKLEYLWLHNNNIPRITANAFNTLTNLKGLSLDGNAVRALSGNAFSKTTELEYLWLSADEITNISGSVFSKPIKLKYLSLSLNKVTSLPAALFSKLTRLQYLKLSVNAMTTLPANLFSRLSNVRYLRLSGNGITSLPAQVCTFINNVRYVKVSGFDLETVCPSSAAGVSVTNFFQRMIDRGSDWVSGATGMTTGTGVTTSNASAGFTSYNENVITKLYEDNIKPSEISRLTGYDEHAVSQIIQSQPLLQ